MRSSHKIFILLCVCAIGFVASDAFADCRIEGILRGTDGAPLAGAQVRVQGPGLRATLTATSGADGRYAVDAVKPGEWVRISAVKDGRTIAQAFALITSPIERLDLTVAPLSVALVSEELDPEDGPSGDVRGIVRGSDGLPIPGARVAIGDTSVATTADSAGRYMFRRLRSGLPIDVNVSASGFADGTASVVVPTGGHATTDFVLEPAPAAANVEGQSFITSAPDTGVAVVRPDTAAGLPVLTDRDLMRAIQFLPAVAGSLEASSELYVRGGTPGQTLMTLDGLTMYPFPHAFGAFSAVNMDAIERADFSETAVNAADGGHLAGALRLVGAIGGATGAAKPAGAVDLGILGWNAQVGASIGDRVSFLVAARATPPTRLYDRVLDMLSGTSGDSARDRVARFSGGVFSAAPSASSFHDVNGKVEVRPTTIDRVSFTLYDAHDNANLSRNLPLPAASTSIAVPSTFPALPSDALAETSDVQTWKGSGVSAQWERRWSPAFKTHVSFGHSEFSRSADASSIVTSPSTSADYSFVAGRGGSGGVSESNTITDTTVSVDTSLGLGFRHFVSAGGQVTTLDADDSVRSETLLPSPRSGVLTSTLPVLFSQSGGATITALYAQDSWRPLARLTIAPGIRLTHNDRVGETYVDPRASGSYQLGRWVRLVGAWTIDHQMANRVTREDLTRGDSEFWTVADGTSVLVPRAQQIVGGASLDLGTLVFDVRGYYKMLDDLTMLAPRLFPGSAPTPGNQLLYDGSRRAKGIELHLGQKAPANTLSTSLAVGRAEDTFPSLEAAAFPASSDDTVEFKIADTVRLGRAWSLGGALVAGSGRPETPATAVTQVWFPSGQSVYAISFGAKNSERLPPYHRLDVTAQRVIGLHWFNATIVGTVFNVYDRQNIAYRQYWTADAQPVITDVTLLRRTYDVVLRVSF